MLETLSDDVTRRIFGVGYTARETWPRPSFYHINTYTHIYIYIHTCMYTLFTIGWWIHSSTELFLISDWRNQNIGWLSRASASQSSKSSSKKGKAIYKYRNLFLKCIFFSSFFSICLIFAKMAMCVCTWLNRRRRVAPFWSSRNKSRLRLATQTDTRWRRPVSFLDIEKNDGENLFAAAHNSFFVCRCDIELALHTQSTIAVVI